jgi:hypothetical protein
LNGTGAKTVVALVATVGSNPTLSAKRMSPVSDETGDIYYLQKNITFQPQVAFLLLQALA